MSERPTDAGRVRAARFTPGLVRVLSSDGDGVGLGLLVGEREIVTCAHVVNYALDREAMAVEAPDVPVHLDFPFATSGRRFTAEVVAWKPLAEDGRGDVAGLRLHGPPPEAAIPSSMTAVDDLFGHPFQVFGFLDGHETGVWVTGELRGSDIVGSLHLVGEAQSGLRVSPGFSGSPVWDGRLEAVVGITSRAAIGAGTAPSAYCLSAATIVDAWPEIERTLRPPCPFRGLQAFREADEEFLFGRTEPVRRLTEELPRHRFSIVAGPSGCGKSSLLNAGVVPALKRRSDLVVRVCRPGVSPHVALAEAVAPRLIREFGTDGAASRSHGVLVREAAAELDRAERERLVLVVDQSEELFAHPPETVEAVTGLLARLASARRPDGRPLACVVAVVRGDYLDPLVELPAVLRALGEGRADPQSGIRQVLPMSPSELRETIEGPVRRARVVRLEDGLVDRLMRDVRGLSNPITLIAFTMTALWDRQRHGTLALSGYEEINGVAGALRRHMDRVLDEELTEHEQEEAQSLLTSLAIPHGADGYVRRQLSRTGVREEHWRLAQQLAGRRVITLGVAPDGTETMELAHEALLDEWPRLRGWLDADRRFLEWRTDLSMAMAQHEADPDRSAGLLSGALLEEADGWIRERAHDLTEAELEFVGESHRMQRLGRRVVLGCAGTMVVILAAAATFVVLWYSGRVDAEATADAEAARANESQALMTGDPSLALPSVVAGYRGDVPDAAQRARWRWHTRTELVQWVRPMNFSLTDAAVFSPDGEHVLHRNSQDDVLLTTLTDPALPAVTVAPETPMPGRAFTPDGRFAVYSDGNGDLVFWDVAKKRATRRLPTFGDGRALVRLIAVAPSGDAVAYARGDEVWIVDGATGRRRDSFRHVPDPLSKQAEELWFDSTGRRLYIWGGAQHSVIDRDSGKRRELEAYAGQFHTASGSAYVSCKNKKIVEGKNGEPPSEPDGVARLFDATSGEQIGPARSLQDSCNRYAFAADSEELFIFHDEQQLALPSSTSLAVSAKESGKAAGQFDVPTARAVHAVTETPEGTRLLVDAGDSYYRLLVPRRESMNRSLSIAGAANITNDGKRVMTLSPGDGLRVWDRATGRGIAAVPSAKACVGTSLLPAVAATADGTRAAALCGRRVTVVDTASGRRIAGATLGAAQGRSKSTKPDHQPTMGLVTPNLLLVGIADRTMAWDLTTGQWNPLPVARFFDTYAGWTPRPGHPQIAAGRRDGRAIDILDVRNGRRVTTIPAPSGTANLGLQVRFDPAGRMLASAGAARESTSSGTPPTTSLTLWNVDEKKKVAELERKDLVTLAALVRSGTTLAFHTSDPTEGTLSFWREHDSWIPFKGGDLVDAIPTKALNIRLDSDGAHGVYQDIRGWHLLDPDPDDWTRRLCRILTEGRLSGAPAQKASGQSSCD